MENKKCLKVSWDDYSQYNIYYGEIKNVWNHQPVNIDFPWTSQRLFPRFSRVQDTQLHQHLDRIQAIDACLRRMGNHNTPIHQNRHMLFDSWLTYPSEKWWSSSVGMMKFPIYGKIKFICQTTNQLSYVLSNTPKIDQNWSNCICYHAVSQYIPHFKANPHGGIFRWNWS